MTTYDPTLPAGSTLGKSYETGVDINIGTDAVPIWQPVRRAFNINPAMTPIQQNAQTYDDQGSPNADVTAWSFVLSLSAYVNRDSATGVMPPELKALQDRYGDAVAEDAVVGVRWYHKPVTGAPDPNEAFEGKATVNLTRGNVGPEGTNELLNITLTGKGKAVRIANPFTGWAGAATVPTVTGVSPAGAAPGDLVTLSGTAFTGASDVTIDGLSAEYTVVGSSTIVAAIPDTVTGTVDVTVTTAAGTSPAFSYTAA